MIDTATLFSSFTLTQLADRCQVGVRAVRRWQKAQAVPPRYHYIAKTMLAELTGASVAETRKLSTGPKGPVTGLLNASELERARYAAALSMREAAKQIGISPAYLARLEHAAALGQDIRVSPELADRLAHLVPTWKAEAVLTPRRVRFALRGLGWTLREISAHLGIDVAVARAWRLGRISNHPPSPRQLRLLGLAENGAFLTDPPRTYWEAVCRAGGMREVLRRDPGMTPAKLRAWVLAPPLAEDIFLLAKLLGQDKGVVEGWWSLSMSLPAQRVPGPDREETP